MVKKIQFRRSMNHIILIFILVILVVGFVVYFSIIRHVERMHTQLTKTYCINLDDAHQRRKNIIERFHPMGYRVEFVSATDTRGDKWKQYVHYLTPGAQEQIKRAVRRGKRAHHYELTPGAVGCFISHIQCWERFLATNPRDDDLLFILEDDSTPQPSFSKTMNNILTYIPGDADIFLLSYIANNDFTKKKTRNFLFNQLNRNCVFYLTNAYIITGRGVKNIWKQLSKSHFMFEKQVDSYLSDLLHKGILTIYCTLFNICPQDTTVTSIQTLPV